MCVSVPSRDVGINTITVGQSDTGCVVVPKSGLSVSILTGFHLQWWKFTFVLESFSRIPLVHQWIRARTGMFRYMYYNHHLLNAVWLTWPYSCLVIPWVVCCSWWSISCNRCDRSDYDWLTHNDSYSLGGSTSPCPLLPNRYTGPSILQPFILRLP